MFGREIKWVEATFGGRYGRTYSYLCDISVEEGDYLVVETPTGLDLVQCLEVHYDEPPSNAFRPILGIFDSEKYLKPDIEPRKEKEMKGFGNIGDRMMNRFFRKVDGVKWDLFTGKVGVQNSEGIVTLEGTGDDAQISINMLDEFGMPVPAFAQNTPLESVSVGDLIYQGNTAKGWVTDIVKNEEDKVRRFRLMTPTGTTTTWTPPKVSMLGFDSGVMVLRSLLNLLPEGEGGLSSMQGMLLPMMMMGGDNNLDKMMPLILFSQLGANGTGEGAMGNNMVQMMLMMQMMGGKGSSSFFD